MFAGKLEHLPIVDVIQLVKKGSGGKPAVAPDLAQESAKGSVALPTA